MVSSGLCKKYGLELRAAKTAARYFVIPTSSTKRGLQYVTLEKQYAQGYTSDEDLVRFIAMENGPGYLWISFYTPRRCGYFHLKNAALNMLKESLTDG